METGEKKSLLRVGTPLCGLVCGWPYGAVCGHEKDDPTRPLEKLTKAQAMEQIREEEAHGKAMDPGTD